MFDFKVDEKAVLDLQKSIEDVPLHLTKKVHIGALRSAARPIYNELDHTTPYQFGHLVSDLTIRKSKFQEENEHGVIVGYKAGRGHAGFIGRFLEFGTKFIAERRFMRKAEENNKQKAEAIYTARIQQIVNKILE